MSRVTVDGERGWGARVRKAGAGQFCPQMEMRSVGGLLLCQWASGRALTFKSKRADEGLNEAEEISQVHAKRVSMGAGIKDDFLAGG